MSASAETRAAPEGTGGAVSTSQGVSPRSTIKWYVMRFYCVTMLLESQFNMLAVNMLVG